MDRNSYRFQRFYGSEGVWKNPNFRVPKMATIGTLRSVHWQAVPSLSGDTYVLKIYHAIGFHGKGFFARLEFFGGVRTSEMFYGTNQETYNKALNAGHILYSTHQAELKSFFESNKGITNEHNS